MLPHGCFCKFRVLFVDVLVIRTCLEHVWELANNCWCGYGSTGLLNMSGKITCLHTYKCVCVHICIYVYVKMCVCVSTCVHIRVHIHIHYIYIHTYIHMHTHIDIFQSALEPK